MASTGSRPAPATPPTTGGSQKLASVLILREISGELQGTRTETSRAGDQGHSSLVMMTSQSGILSARSLISGYTSLRKCSDTAPTFTSSQGLIQEVHFGARTTRC